LLNESPPCSPKSQPTKFENVIMDSLEQLSPVMKPTIKEEKKIDSSHYETGEPPKEESQPKTSPIRQSISILRRMNSDAKEDNYRDSGMKGTERYFNVGPLKGGVERNGSWISLLADKVLSRNRSKMDLVSDSQNAVRDSYISQLETGSCDVDVTDPEIAMEREDAVSELPWPTRYGRPSEVNVWEDGEHYWRDQSTGGAMNTNGGITALAESTPVRVNIQSPSNEATPRSLYDQKGFLI
jgi:hypothetical protein